MKSNALYNVHAEIECKATIIDATESQFSVNSPFYAMSLPAYDVVANDLAAIHFSRKPSATELERAATKVVNRCHQSRCLPSGFSDSKSLFIISEKNYLKVKHLFSDHLSFILQPVLKQLLEGFPHPKVRPFSHEASCNSFLS